MPGEQVLPGVRAGGTAEIAFRRDLLDLVRLRRVEITFDDVVGHHYRVEVPWNVARRTFGYTTVTERRGLKLEHIAQRRPRQLRWRRTA